MKKVRILSMALLFLMLSSVALAGGVRETIEVLRNNAQLIVNGKRLQGDTFTYNNTTYVPVEALAKALGAGLDWNAANSTYSLTGVQANGPALTYPDKVDAMEPRLSLGQLSIAAEEMEAYRLEKNGALVEVQAAVEGDTLQLMPKGWLDYSTKYTLKLYLKDGSRRVINFQTGSLPKLQAGPLQKLIYVPAMPDKGFNYPYYLQLPSRSSIQRNSGKKNFLMVETHNTGKVSDDLAFHIEEALTVAQGNSASIAEALGLPRIVPILVRPASTIAGHQIYTHDLSRQSLLLGTYKKQEPNYNPVFGPMDRVDLQVAAMIKHANDYLRENGWKMEEKVFMWGFSASGGFANHFTFLHPHLVKAAVYGSFPTLPVATVNGVNMIYPLGTYDYKALTGREFSLEAYNQVAKLGYIGSVDHNNPTLASDIYSPEEQEIIRKVLAVTEYPDRWNLQRKLFQESGGEGQANVYIGAGHVTFYKGMGQDYLNFFKANRESDKPVYVRPSDPNTTTTDIYSKSIVEVKPEPFSYDKTTIIEAFWSGSLPKLLPSEFVDFYKTTDRFKFSDRSVLLAIAEWDYTKNHTQFGERLRAIGSEELTLRAKGYPDVVLRLSAGSMNGSGAQCYVAEVKNPQAMVDGVKYEIVDTTGHWIVDDGVYVMRPKR